MDGAVDSTERFDVTSFPFSSSHSQGWAVSLSRQHLSYVKTAGRAEARLVSTAISKTVPLERSLGRRGSFQSELWKPFRKYGSKETRRQGVFL